MDWLGYLLFALIVWVVFIRKSKPSAPAAATPAAAPAQGKPGKVTVEVDSVEHGKADLDWTKLQETAEDLEVVGESFARAGIKYIAKNSKHTPADKEITVHLVPVVHPKDPNAIAVACKNILISYIAKADCPVYFEYVALKGKPRAITKAKGLIEGGYEDTKKNRWFDYSVTIETAPIMDELDAHEDTTTRVIT